MIDGTAVAADVLAQTAERAAIFRAETGRMACLATVLVRDDPASRTYVRMKTNRCALAGIESRRHELAADATTAQVVSLVAALSADPAVDGVLVQHPVPSQVDERAVFEAIAPGKDVDGVTKSSFAAISLGQPRFASCTPAGIMLLLDAYDLDIAGAHAVVVGRSPILGKPVGMLLLGRDATVTYCHSKTRELPRHVASADILVAGVGRPAFIQGDWLKPGVVVIDAGYNPGNIGDVDFAPAAERASFITPVPGGFLPTTIAVLLANTVSAAQAHS